MKLTVKRLPEESSVHSTLGHMLVDDAYFCHTLEDVVRPEGVKIDGETAIPYGVYKVIIDQSTRFGRLMPHILDVPGFDGVRIHSGNTDKDTEGCILLGYDVVNSDLISNSKAAFDAFFTLLQNALQEGEVTIEVTK